MERREDAQLGKRTRGKEKKEKLTEEQELGKLRRGKDKKRPIQGVTRKDEN